MVPNSSIFMEQMRKQQLLQTARQKANKSRKKEARGLAAASSQSTLSLTDSGTKNANIKSEAVKTSQSIEESKSREKLAGLPNWFGKKNPPGTGLQFKFANFENRLIRFILEKQGFRESVQDYGMPAADFYNIANAANCNFLNSNQVVLIWSASVVKSNIYSNLGRFQRINHFPRSYEITRKDCLYERYSRMQALYS